MRPAGTLRLVLVAAAVTLAAVSCATRDNRTTQDADPTHTLFQRQCAACHGHDGEGRQIGTLKVPSLRAGRAATDTDERLSAQIHEGGNGMPPFKYSLTDEQIGDLLRFVRDSLQGRAAPKQ